MEGVEEKFTPSTPLQQAEVDRFTVNESLTDLERAALYINGKEPIQVAAALRSLPGLVASHGRIVFDTLVPLIKRGVAAFDPDICVALAEALEKILLERSLPPRDLVDVIAPVVLHQIRTASPLEVQQEAWLQTLSAMVPLMDKNAVVRDVLSFALAKASLEEPLPMRCLACKLLGVITPHMSGDLIQKHYFAQAKVLCQDLSQDVRFIMCSRVLSPMITSLGPELAKQLLLDDIIELIQDDHQEVRHAALECLVNSLPTLKGPGAQEKLMLCLRKHMQPFELDLPTQRVVARLLGLMVTQIAPLESADHSLFFGCYNHLAARQDPEIRLQCARNFPAVLQAADPATFLGQFSETFARLAADTEEAARLSIASQFHLVSKMVGNERTQQGMVRALVRLLDDSSRDVLLRVLKGFAAGLERFKCADAGRNAGGFQEIGRALARAETRFPACWRLSLALARAMPALAKCLQPDTLHELFLPIAFRYLTSGAACIKDAAAEGLVCIFRELKREKQRTEVVARLLREFARGKSYQMRIAYISVCHHLMQRFSSAFFKAHFLSPCLECALDRVSNVRMAATRVLPLIKQTIRLPEDLDFLERLNSAMSNLVTDVDRDVCAAGRAMQFDFKAVPVRVMGAGVMGSGQGYFDPHSSRHEDREQQDRQKELEEADFTLNTDEIEKVKHEEERSRGSGGASTSASAASRRTTGITVHMRPESQSDPAASGSYKRTSTLLGMGASMDKAMHDRLGGLSGASSSPQGGKNVRGGPTVRAPPPPRTAHEASGRGSPQSDARAGFKLSPTARTVPASRGGEASSSGGAFATDSDAPDEQVLPTANSLPRPSAGALSRLSSGSGKSVPGLLVGGGVVGAGARPQPTDNRGLKLPALGTRKVKERGAPAPALALTSRGTGRV